MTKIKVSLLKIVGRIKEYMPGIFIGMASFLIPLGMSLCIFAVTYMHDLSILFWLGACLAALGSITLVLAYTEQTKLDRKSDSINQKLILTLDAIYYELLKRR